MFIKGAPDYLIERTDSIMNNQGKVVKMTKQDKDKLMNYITTLAEKGLRTLAICIQEDCGELSDYDGIHHKAH